MIADNVFPFPISRSSHWVEHTACQVLAHNGPAADKFWRELVAGLRRDMKRCGVNPKRAEDELYDFASAVSCRVGMVDGSYQDGGAA